MIVEVRTGVWVIEDQDNVNWAGGDNDGRIRFRSKSAAEDWETAKERDATPRRSIPRWQERWIPEDDTRR